MSRVISAPAAVWPATGPITSPTRNGCCTASGVGRAEVGEVGEQVGVGFEALRGDLAVAQPGEAVAVDVLDGPAAVGIEGGLGVVVAQDVGQHLQGGRLGLFGAMPSKLTWNGPASTSPAGSGWRAWGPVAYRAVPVCRPPWYWEKVKVNATSARASLSVSTL